MLPRLLTSASLSVVLCAGCAPPQVPSAPDALDENVKWFWVNADSASDGTLLTAAQKLAVAAKADTRTSPFKGQNRQRLTSEDLTPVGLQQNDPSTARGLLVVNLFDCTLERLASILSDPAQNTLYPGVWTSNVRTLESDRQPFLDQTEPLLRWSADISITFPIADTYTSVIKGSLRRVKPPSAEVFPSDVLLSRVWLTAPATFGPNSTSSFTQNYELHLYWEQSPGRVLHAVGAWRELRVGALDKTLEDDDFFTLNLNELVDWDGKTASLCAK